MIKNNFREYEKRFRTPPKNKKGRKQTTVKYFYDLKEAGVIDFHDLTNNLDSTNDNIVDCTEQYMNENGEAFNQPNDNFALNLDVQKIYGVKNVEGLYFIPNPFTPKQQKYWISHVIKHYPIGNSTNISNLEYIRTRRKLLNTEDENVIFEDNRYSENNNNNQEEDDREENEEIKKLIKSDFYIKEWNPEMFSSLRWATVGYHFQWTGRKYTSERGMFPDDLNILTSKVSSLIGYDMKPESGTINFYPDSSYRMGGHIDNSEHDMTKPIISFSFGNSVIFIIGGETKETIPTALFISSGDILIMSGKSRYCYHGVPRMIPNTCPEYLSDFNEDVDIDSEIPDWDKFCSDYITVGRLNMNMRQVINYNEEHKYSIEE
eukprot:TRINITY_DN4986_c0_g1_i1.p1 TRINITY_DN4986_c0_g1~~TRINITY_DN4986_c0_g1_i1.p1  ORF type:complete len:376 (+),score=122.44 TRINITY_DN4986_c0_g1_i1:55-1182(+)